MTDEALAVGAYVTTPFVVMYAPLRINRRGNQQTGAQTCQKTARLRHPRHVCASRDSRPFLHLEENVDGGGAFTICHGLGDGIS